MPAILDFLQKKLQGCPPRLCSLIYVVMISIGQPFTAGHVCFPENLWFGSWVNTPAIPPPLDILRALI